MFVAEELGIPAGQDADMSSEPTPLKARNNEAWAERGVRWRALLALLLGAALATLPSTLFSIVLFHHMQRLALPMFSVALFYPPYPIGLFLASLPAAAFLDRFGPRRIFLVSIALVSALSIAAALPLEPWVLIGLRFLQGMASAGLLVACLALVRPVFGEARQGIGLGFVVVAGVAGAALLPMLLGLAASIGPAGPVLISLLLVLTVFAMGWQALPAGVPNAVLDVMGTVLNFLSLGLLLGALHFAPFRPWLSLALFISGLLVLTLWVWRQKGRTVSVLPLDLLMRPESRYAVGAALLGGLAIAAIGTSTPSRLMVGEAVSPEALGLLLLVGAATTILAACLGGWGIQRWSGWQAAMVGTLFLTAGVAVLALPWGGMAGASVAVVILGAGRGLFESGNARALVGDAPPGREAAAAGLLVAAGALGGVLAPFLTLLLFLLGEPAGDDPDNAFPAGLGLQGLLVLLAAWLSKAGGKPSPPTRRSA